LVALKVEGWNDVFDWKEKINEVLRVTVSAGMNAKVILQSAPNILLSLAITILFIAKPSKGGTATTLLYSNIIPYDAPFYT
jgi:hypothetical protein